MKRVTSTVAAGAARRLAPALAASAAVHALLLGVILSARPRPTPAVRVVGVEIVAPRRSSSAGGSTSGEASRLRAPGRLPAGPAHPVAGPADTSRGAPLAEPARRSAAKVGATSSARIRAPPRPRGAPPPAPPAPEVAPSRGESGPGAAADARPGNPSAGGGSNPGGGAGASALGGGDRRGAEAGDGSGEGGGSGQGVTGPLLDAIREQIGRAVLYPASARRSRLQGRVLVRFTIGSDGTVKDVCVVASSGYDVLDRSAVSAILAAAPFGGVDRDVFITTPIVFRLE